MLEVLPICLKNTINRNEVRSRAKLLTTENHHGNFFRLKRD